MAQPRSAAVPYVGLPPPIRRAELAQQLGASLVGERQAPDDPRLGSVAPLRGTVLAEQEALLSEEIYLRRQGFQWQFAAPRSWIVVVLEGCIAVDLGGRQHPLLMQATGENLCLTRAVSQEFTVLQAPLRLLRLGLPPELSWAPAELHGHRALPLLEAMVRLLQQAQAERAPADTRQRLWDALKGYCATELQPLGVQLQASAHDPLQALLDWLPTCLGQDLHLADLARAACLSPRRLQELCLQRFACSPMDLLRQLRLDALRDDLANPGQAHLAVGQLYRRWQLADSAATRKAFEARFGQSPAALRKQLASAAARS